MATDAGDGPTDGHSRTFDRRAFLRRLAAAGFAVPTVTTFFADDVAGAARVHPHLAPITTAGLGTTVAPTTPAPTTPAPTTPAPTTPAPTTPAPTTPAPTTPRPTTTLFPPLHRRIPHGHN